MRNYTICAYMRLALVAIFKDQIMDLVENIWNSINKEAGKIYR